jgi:hypothetical protein
MGFQPQVRFDDRHSALALECGMQPTHARNLARFVQRQFKGKPLLVLVRASKSAALAHHGQPGFLPKPIDVKTKSGPDGSLSAGSENFFSDYDLLGVWERRDAAYVKLRSDGGRESRGHVYYRLFTGNWIDAEAKERGTGKQLFDLAAVHRLEPAAPAHLSEAIGTKDPALNEFLRQINLHVCGTQDPRQFMFQHGSQDGFRLGGRPLLPIGKDERVLVFEPDGTISKLVGRAQVKGYYLENNLTWIYRD